ncbi:Valine--tRNA ligase, mitochondrial [Podospora pseudoanserina]|uniref:valine--tRNA ligase n=1 Tax=Podospora pseudoanserina TaxID=2609844 RepID=A0ABR0IRZ6_9PEZI|nr:Valine--tRNA ligase, mitochondrial [Podospora pseudoanserina]
MLSSSWRLVSSTRNSLLKASLASFRPEPRTYHSSAYRLSKMADEAAKAPAPATTPAAAPDAPAPKKNEAKEKAKAEKAAKFAAKQAAAKLKQQQQAGDKPAEAPKPKAKKAETPVLPRYKDETPAGEKKKIQPFDHPHFSAYNPQAVESSWYSWWEKSGYFKPQEPRTPDAGKFVIALPPPNVTGALHCGHALANSLQDTLIRWNRMKGLSTLWVPGCDHAGIATQSVVEKMLYKREKKTRHDLGREEFTKRVWEWKGEYHERINNAQRLMGGSMDWSREAFTMDENLTAAVMEAFVTLHDEGLIYRSNRLVNWSTHLRTALSTLEVINKDITGRTMIDVPGYDRKVEFGVLTYFKYPIEGSDEFITVATTRPETMLGDSGIAVSPGDARYAHLVGKHARHPFTRRLMPIVEDSYVDPEFGTGAVKLTPAHDFNDYKLGVAHKLEFINVLTEDGLINENGAMFQGQKRFNARYTVVEELARLGLFVKKEPNAMVIPICERSGDVIEPRMAPQWWVKMEDMARDAMRVVESGEIKISPESARKSYFQWLNNITDWCISRQLWWGHRIPAYRIVLEGEDSEETDKATWVVGRNAEEAKAKAAEKAAELFPGKNYTLEQDPDCLDTWFSSGLWPMAILGWPNTEKDDFKKFFPTELLESGWDILFFWIARMIMLSLKLTGKVPFTEVYCHSLIRDAEGRKMSKSLGNVIDPLDIINGIKLEDLHAKLLTGNLRSDEVERATKYQKQSFPGGIPECGADALRFTLLSYTTGGGDINFDIRVMAAYRRFCNKVWQASKYVLGNLGDSFKPDAQLDLAALSVPERWIVHRTNAAVKGINEALTNRQFSTATRLVYSLFYDDFCDIFVENSKGMLGPDADPAQANSVRQVLYFVLDTCLRLLHPMLPFITEELWQRLPRKAGDETPSILLAPYPEADQALEFPAESADYELGLKCASGIRSLAAEYNIRDGRAFIVASTPAALEKVSAQLNAIKTLSGRSIASTEVIEESATPKGCAVSVVNAEIVVLLQVSDQITDIAAEIKKITTKLQKTTVAITKQEELINREGFEKVSDVVVTAEKKKLADAQAAKENYERTLAEFSKLKL